MRTFLFALHVVAAATSLQAQRESSAPLVLTLPVSTRALGLGNAYVLVGRESDALFANPGALNQARGSGIAVQRYGSSGTLGVMSTAREWASGGLAFGAQVLAYHPQTANFANLETDAGTLLSSGSFGAAEFVASIGYGRVVKGIRVGVAAKVIEQRLAGARDATLAADVGLTKAVAGVTFGVAMQNLGPGLQMGEAKLPLPHRVTVGASIPSKVVGPLDLLGTAAVSRRHDGEIIPAAGVEVSYWPIVGRTFTGRIGVRRVPGGTAGALTFGAAFTGDEITIEYAFEEFDAAGSAHRIGLRWR
jgi:hypothetical protein